MSTPTSATTARAASRPILNKVPEITVYFWTIKILCTTVGESAADYLNSTLGFGLGNTTIVMSVLLVASLVAQFRVDRYVPGVYWTTVVLISVVGTLITDNLTDGLSVSLIVSTVSFSVLLALTFVGWYRVEHTLSIHSIVTRRRETFYWLAVLFTFALGTAAGDLLTDRLGLGLFTAVVIFAVAIAVVYVAHRWFGLGPVLSFWIAYVLTRPLGGSTGDYLSGATDEGGAGLGTLATSLLFLAAIVATVVYLTIAKKDRTELVHTGPSGAPGSDHGGAVPAAAGEWDADRSAVVER
ncbi:MULTISPECIES: COG4705 family protein [Pseudofrankia]|uniref:COG4705 family protein n=1 Tax=Pseudofrankia TaxID=2994363 RepID=UPI000234D53F|nr:MULTISPECIES: membrane protein [Pseudofrankia]